MKNCPLLRHCFIVSCLAFSVAQPALAQTSPTPPTPPTPPPTPAAPTPATPPIAAPAPPAPVYKEGVIKVGKELKQSRGLVFDIEKGDNGCYLTLRNGKNEFIEVARFEICAQKPPVKGKQVEMTFSMESIQAGDCYGDPKCKRTETVPLVTAVKIID
ncbi:MAG: hypothetical protein LH481_00355 [Burkholderiales bacterium]|nr:hypothetical protein [Burkholderiales bacterium]